MYPNYDELIDGLGLRILNAATGPSADPMPANKREIMASALQLGCVAIKALVRIADALEAHAPARPSEDAHNAL